MKTTAVISEYNPFHSGHKYLIDTARKNGSTHIISIMGGNFLQRGNCAIVNKYARARSAILGGSDIVLELPQIYACASAERFAFGAAETLVKCGCVDELCFGAECGDVNLLRRIAGILDGNGEAQALCRSYMKQGFSYPRAMNSAVRELLSDKKNAESEIAELLKSPNNTLGIEYIRALDRAGSAIEPFAVKRVGALHDSDAAENGFASASAVRSMILGGGSYADYVPESTAEIIEECIKNGSCPAAFGNNERGVISALRRMTARELEMIPDVEEGLENRIMRAVRENNELSDIIMSVKCKRYTHARLSRIVACAYLGITKDVAALSPEYIRVLAFNGRGAEILKIMKKSAGLPVVMSPAKDMKRLGEKGRLLLELDIRASDLHGLLTPRVQGCSEDYYKGAVKVEC